MEKAQIKDFGNIVDLILYTGRNFKKRR